MNYAYTRPKYYYAVLSYRGRIMRRIPSVCPVPTENWTRNLPIANRSRVTELRTQYVNFLY